MKKLLLLFFVPLALACSDDGGSDGGLTPDNFDRSAVLSNWANNIIVPGYVDFASKTGTMKSASDTFFATPDQTNLDGLRAAWLEAYKTWQKVSMFEIGKAEELRFRNNVNIYPADAAGILSNAQSGTYNLSLSSEIDKQGFPAIEYLLYGIEDNDTDILARYTSAADAANMQAYLKDVVDRIDDLTNQVLDDWQGGFSTSFIANDGSSATSSLNRLANDYLFYYEKALRAGKVGIPAGVFSADPISESVEGRYNDGISKEMALIALQAAQDFFNGVAYSSSAQGESFASYLDYLNVTKNGSDLATLINNQFNSARSAINTLDDDFEAQVENNNGQMLQAYDELQKNVVLLKVDMMQAFNVSIDFVDADGD